MKYFLSKLALFLLPCFFIFIPPFLVFFANYEFLSLTTIVNRQQNSQEEVLYLPGLTSAADLPYKIQSLLVRDPEIMVFGTSRTLTLKSTFFRDPSLFYNAGYTAGKAFKAEDLLTLVTAIPEKSAMKVILFDVSSFLKKDAEGKQEYSIPYSMARTFFTAAWRDTYLGYAKGEFTLNQIRLNLDTNNNIGMRPRLYGVGYRRDGSLERNMHKDKDTFYADVEKNIQSDMAFIVKDHGGFSDYDDSIPSQNVAVVDRFLAACKAKNIYVIGYFSPNAQEIHEKMLTLDDRYGNSYRRAPQIIGDVFEKNGYHFYDIQDLKTIGSSDKEMYDPHHPTEKASIKLLSFLLSREPLLKRFTDVTTLQEQLQGEEY
jgi:hypothetical protein